MADTFYSTKIGDVFIYASHSVVVGSSATSANPIEVRVTDGACTAEQVYQFLEKLADYISTRNSGVVPVDTLIG